MTTRLEYSPTLIAGAMGVGPFQMEIVEDGGIISGLQYTIGYGHRGLENVAQNLVLKEAAKIADRLDFLSAPACNLVVSMAIESLAGVEISPRAQYIRTVLLEIGRIYSHLTFLAGIARSVGYPPIAQYCLREREKFADVYEMFCGSRLGFGAVCIGGVTDNATEGWLFRIEKAQRSLSEFFPELEALIIENPASRARMEGLARLTPEQIALNNITGPNARASGVRNDLRISRPYCAYAALDFGAFHKRYYLGDAMARVGYRIEEMKESSALLEQLLHRLPEGNYRVPIGRNFSLPAGEAFTCVESARGHLGVYLVSEGGSRLSRLKFTPPSVLVMRVIPDLLIGERVEDLFLAVQSLDPSLSEVDR